MFKWLQGPGAAFRDPLPGSTNYLCAYNKDGTLFRSRKPSAGFSDAESTEGEQAPASSRDEPLPEEREQDLRPFPMNPDFRSQPVLDESLREEIYNRVMVDGKPVKVVSAELGVEMNRVGAVVRLKEIEKRWIKEVYIQDSLEYDLRFSFYDCFYDDLFQTISLEDQTNGYTTSYASLSDFYFYFHGCS